MPERALLQRRFFSGGLSVSLWLRRGGREAGGGRSRLFGCGSSSIFIFRSRPVPFVFEREVRHGFSGRRRFSASRPWGHLARDGDSRLMVRRARVLFLLGMVCAGGSFYHSGGLWVRVRSRVGARTPWLARVRSCLRFKGWSSMPPQWPRALLPHLRTSFRGSDSVFQFVSPWSRRLSLVVVVRGFRSGTSPLFFISSLRWQVIV